MGYCICVALYVRKQIHPLDIGFSLIKTRNTKGKRYHLKIFFLHNCTKSRPLINPNPMGEPNDTFF